MDLDYRSGHESLENIQLVVNDDTIFERVDEGSIDLGLPCYSPVIDIVQSKFGFSVKKYQAGAINDILRRKKDVFVIAGTGSGKSLVYQVLPLLVEEAIVLVVCPTLSLMDDQVLRFKRIGVTSIALSADNIAHKQSLWKDVEQGKFSLVLASPEVLLREGSYFWDNILRNKKSAFCARLFAIVVDECHLVWGWREFRKDYLGLGSLRAHFPRVTMVAMSATVTPNVLRFVVKTIGLRDGFRLYKQSIDRTNISQFVCQINHSRNYQQLLPLLVDTGATWTIPKTMVFIDSIDEATMIARFLRDSVPDHQCEYAAQIVRPFHASLEPFLCNEYLQSFREGDCRILVCTDAAGMGVDIPDVGVVIQWGISEHLTLAMLWQRIGRAGRDANLEAIAITFVHERHMLPLAIPGESIWHGFNHPVDPQNAEYSKAFIRRIYSNFDTSQSGRFAAPTPYHKVDPPVLWYLNTSGCRGRCVMASFIDNAAYAPCLCGASCCDNCIFDKVDPTGPGIRDFRRHRFGLTSSVRYLQSGDYNQTQVSLAVEMAKEKATKDALRSTRTQWAAVHRALDLWAFENFQTLHRRLFTSANREKLAEACTRITDMASIESEIDSARFCFRESALHPHAESLLDLIKCSLLSISESLAEPSQPRRSTQYVNSVSASHDTIENDSQHYSCPGAPPKVTGPLGGLLGDMRSLGEAIAVLEPLPSYSIPQLLPVGPQNLILAKAVDDNAQLPLLEGEALTSQPYPVAQPVAPTQEEIVHQTPQRTMADVPLPKLPNGITPEMFLKARETLISGLRLSSHLMVPPESQGSGISQATTATDSAGPRERKRKTTTHHDIDEFSTKPKVDGRRRKLDPIMAATRKVDARASQAEKTKVKRAMKDTNKAVKTKGCKGTLQEE